MAQHIPKLANVALPSLEAADPQPQGTAMVSAARTSAEPSSYSRAGFSAFLLLPGRALVLSPKSPSSFVVQLCLCWGCQSQEPLASSSCIPGVPPRTLSSLSAASPSPHLLSLGLGVPISLSSSTISVPPVKVCTHMEAPVTFPTPRSLWGNVCGNLDLTGAVSA